VQTRNHVHTHRSTRRPGDGPADRAMLVAAASVCLEQTGETCPYTCETGHGNHRKSRLTCVVGNFLPPCFGMWTFALRPQIGMVTNGTLTRNFTSVVMTAAYFRVKRGICMNRVFQHTIYIFFCTCNQSKMLLKR